MEVNAVSTLFNMFSGISSVDDYTELIQSSMDDIYNILVDKSNSSDSRLNFVCGSLANWRYQQFISSRDKLNYTYVGSVSQKHDGKDQLKDAENMFYHYLATVKDIIKDDNFYFSNV